MSVVFVQVINRTTGAMVGSVGAPATFFYGDGFTKWWHSTADLLIDEAMRSDAPPATEFSIIVHRA